MQEEAGDAERDREIPRGPVRCREVGSRGPPRPRPVGRAQNVPYPIADAAMAPATTTMVTATAAQSRPSNCSLA